MTLHNQGGELKLEDGVKAYCVRLAQVYNEKLECDTLQLTLHQDEEIIGKITTDSDAKIIAGKFEEVEIFLMMSSS